MHSRLLLPALGLLIFPLSAALAQPAAAPSFERDVRPLLKAHCFECHGEGKKLRGGLDLRLRRLMAEGGDHGPALVPGKAAESLLVQKVRSGAMPPGKTKLNADEIARLERWIAAGAAVAGPEPKELPLGFAPSPEERAFWAFQPIRRPAVPLVKDQARVRTPIDAFLLAKLESKKLGYGPQADRVTLIRRASFDLLGLPPTPEDVTAFVHDSRPDAYERLVDRLLDSPHYGERWGRHWLDVAGYADSEGYTGADPVRATAWRYRDYVIRSFNADRPFDEWIREQLAGDEMVRPPYEKLAPAELDRLIATGFLRLAPDGTASRGVDVKAASNQAIADTLQIVSTSLLGLTLHCAQCHNHRYDPIAQLDYYRFRAIFEPALDASAWRAPAAREVALFKDEDRRRADAIEKEAAKIDAERSAKVKHYVEATFAKQLTRIPAAKQALARALHAAPPAKRTAEQMALLKEYPFLNVNAGTLTLYERKAAAELKTYSDRAAKLRATKPRPEFLRVLTEVPGKVPITRLFDRGDYEQPREAVAPAHLSILEPLGLPSIQAKDGSLPTTGRRLALARALTSGRHPLPPRVLMNRVWLHHFGRGLVGTPGDFGFLGERPTHPALLDWLADEFVASGWRLKRMHRLLMTSTAYRQASARRPELQAADPDNRLLGRFTVRRLEAEALRDALLAVSGKLNVKAFGPPVPVTHDEIGQVVIGRDIRNPGDGTPKGKVAPLGGEEFRRSVYVQVRRSLPLGMLETFDAPTLTPNCEARNFSTVAPQALLLMNSVRVQQLADAFAARLRAEAGPDVRAQVVRGWRLAYGAAPTPGQADAAVAYLREQTTLLARQPDPAGCALASWCQALLAANRFLYVD